MTMITTIKIAILFLAALDATSVTARPHLQRRGLPGAVYTCTAPDFREHCQWTSPQTARECMQIGPTSANTIMSIGPDPDGTCTLYKKFDCTDEVRTITFPGMAGGLPKFTAFKCMPNANAMPRGINSTRPGALAKTLDPLADPRLAGGFGSVERMHQLEQIKAMEADGFKDGLIGLKKGVYY